MQYVAAVSADSAQVNQVKSKVHGEREREIEERKRREKRKKRKRGEGEF